MATAGSFSSMRRDASGSRTTRRSWLGPLRRSEGKIPGSSASLSSASAPPRPRLLTLFWSSIYLAFVACPDVQATGTQPLTNACTSVSLPMDRVLRSAAWRHRFCAAVPKGEPMKPAWKILIASILALLSTGLAFAQGAAAGDLHVTVRDEKGHLVANATVTAREQAKGLERSTQLNTDGEYRLLSLPPGIYAVTVEAPGFGRSEAKDQSVTVGQRKDLPVTLTVSAGQTVITVSSEAELVQTSRSSTTDTIDQRRIDNLPINGRNYINFALTDSQVLRDNAPSIGAAPTSGLNISGQRGRSNLVNVDGADATDNSVNGVRSTVSQEAVQEFKIITRSGSNDFHGDVYGYLRNRNFQAVNPFSTTPNPAYTRVQGGLAFGGPIKKDKTYYYFAYETTRRHETGFSSIGQDNFGLQGVDVSPIFGAPAGFFPDIQATPDQATFLAANPFPIPAFQLYAFMVGASSGIAVNGSYPSWFAVLPAAFVPAGLQQFPSSCNPAL